MLWKVIRTLIQGSTLLPSIVAGAGQYHTHLLKVSSFPFSRTVSIFHKVQFSKIEKKVFGQ